MHSLKSELLCKMYVEESVIGSLFDKTFNQFDQTGGKFD